MKTSSIYLLVMCGLAIVALGVALAFALFGTAESVGKVLAIAASIIGLLVAVGPALLKTDGKSGE